MGLKYRVWLGLSSRAQSQQQLQVMKEDSKKLKDEVATEAILGTSTRSSSVLCLI